MQKLRVCVSLVNWMHSLSLKEKNIVKKKKEKGKLGQQQICAFI